MAGFSLLQIFIFLLIILIAILQYKNILRFQPLFYYISTFLIIFSICAQIALYFLAKKDFHKYFAIFSILLSLDLLIIINFLEKTLFIKKEDSLEKEFKINFNKTVSKIISLLLILNFIIILLIFSFKKFSFPVNFMLVIAFSFILFILLFRFFELYKEN